MVKINNVVAATVISLLSASPSYAHIHEGKWAFEKDEVQIIDVSSNPRWGFEFGCYKFDPENVSFSVYVLKSPERKWAVISVDGHLSDQTRWLFHKTKKLELGFFGDVKYRIQNITGQKVKCVKGNIGIFP